MWSNLREGENMAGNGQQLHNPFDIFGFLQQADPLAYAILVVLVAMSLACWYVILTKLWDQRRIQRAYEEVRKKFWLTGNLHDGMGALTGRENVFRMLTEDGIRAAQYHQGHLTEQISLN